MSSQFNLDQLKHITPEEAKIAGSMMRPPSCAPDTSFDTEQFCNFLRTLDKCRAADSVITAQGLKRAGMLKPEAVASLGDDDPGVPLRLAV